MQDSSTPMCVLRIFNGALRGCEFVLDQPCTTFVVGPAALFFETERAPSVPADAIYIPLETAGCNFEVLVDDNSRSGCRVRVLEEEGASEQMVAFQTLHAVGGLNIAVRLADEAWAEGLLAADEPASRPAAQALKEVHRKSPWLAPVVAASVLLVVLASAWWNLRTNPVKSVENLIAGSASELQVVVGRDQVVYVFANNERDMNWARQVLMRNGQQSTPVLTPYEERVRLQRLLAEHMPTIAYHRMDFSDLQNPQIWVSAQRTLLTPPLQRELETLLKNATPYAKAFVVRSADDRDLTRRAEQGLARLAVPYERQDKDASVTFTVQGSLQDTELSAVRDFVNEFYQLWGDRYVHFAVELKDDWLKGKSFQYGPKGYIKMTPSSWYFPKPL